MRYKTRQIELPTTAYCNECNKLIEDKKEMCLLDDLIVCSECYDYARIDDIDIERDMEAQEIIREALEEKEGWL